MWSHLACKATGVMWCGGGRMCEVIWLARQPPLECAFILHTGNRRSSAHTPGHSLAVRDFYLGFVCTGPLCTGPCAVILAVLVWRRMHVWSHSCSLSAGWGRREVTYYLYHSCFFFLRIWFMCTGQGFVEPARGLCHGPRPSQLLLRKVDALV